MLNSGQVSPAIGFVALLILSINLGCENPPQRTGNQPPVVGVDSDDERMNLAMAKAKETFSKFEQNWTKPGLDSASIKVAMETNSDGLEHIWFTPTKIEGDQITATCSNQPENIPGLSFGDVRTIDRSKISDWMIMEGSKCYGGYTIRVLAEIDPDNAPPFQFAEFP